MPADEKKVLISLSGLKEMQMIESSPSGLTLGAGLTINAAAKALCAAIEERKGEFLIQEVVIPTNPNKSQESAD